VETNGPIMNENEKKFVRIPITLSDLPPILIKEKEKKLEENFELGETKYQEIVLRDQRPFSWETEHNESLL